MQTHPHLDLLRRFYTAMGSNDGETLRDLHTDDFQLTVAGDSAVSGHFRGGEEAARHAARTSELAGGQLAMHLERLLADDEVGVALFTAEVKRPDGREMTQRLLHECRFSDGRISAIREWIWDQRADREFWS